MTTKTAKRKSRFKTKAERIIEGVGIFTSFYRENPHRLLIDYYGMTWLRPFQQILVNLILKFTYCMIFASRGMGKSQVGAAAIVADCTLRPGLKVTISAGNRGQSTNVIKKIVEEFMPKSANLRNEIKDWNTTPSNAFVLWKNGSVVSVATARQSARSARSNWVFNDEFVQILKTILDSVIRKFKAGQRTPNFYNKPEYKNYPKEPNRETYISSAFYKHHYSWEKFKSFFKSMIRGDSYVCVGFPYQLPVSEGYYPKQQIIDEMQEDDWDAITWSMEMDTLFFGEATNAFFSFNDMEINRVVSMPIYPKLYYDILGDQKIKYTPKTNGEIRVVSMDIATQGGSKNDNTCFSVLQMIPTKNNQYIRQLVYIETMNGGHTYDQAVRLKQLYCDLDCDYVVVDCLGVGVGVYDNLVREIVDEDRGTVYPAWSCLNDKDMADRCKDLNAPKIIYAVKANQQFNNDAAVSMRDCLKRGKLRLLISEIEANDKFSVNKYYHKLSVEDQILLQSPFYQTSLLINETINLSYEVVNGKVKVHEQGNMRKDRYTSVSYANMFANIKERELVEDDDITQYIPCVSAVTF
jgi:hypothetical protein